MASMPRAHPRASNNSTDSVTSPSQTAGPSGSTPQDQTEGMPDADSVPSAIPPPLLTHLSEAGSSSQTSGQPTSGGLVPAAPPRGTPLPHPIHPSRAAIVAKPIRRLLESSGFQHTEFALSARKERSEPVDAAKPWRRMHKLLAELLFLLGPAPPSTTDPRTLTWFNSLRELMLVYQGEALLAIALVEKKRSCPNLSQERATAIIKANWPNWDLISTSLWEAQEKAATSAALIKGNSNTNSNTNKPDPADKDGRVGK